MWSSNIKVFLEQSHIDCFLSSNWVIWWVARHHMAQKTQNIYCPVHSREDSADSCLNNHLLSIIPSLCRVQGGKDYLWLPFLKNNNGATFSEKSNQFNKMNVLRTCLLELMGVLESSFTLGRNSGQALGWIPLTKHSPHCLLQSPPDGAANYHRIQTCGYPRQKVCVFPGWEEGPPKLTWSLLGTQFLTTLLFFQTTVLLALRALRKHNKPQDFTEVFWISSYLRKGLCLCPSALLSPRTSSKSQNLLSFLLTPFHLDLSHQRPSLPQEASKVRRKLCHVAIWFFASMIILFKGNHVKWTSR